MAQYGVELKRLESQGAQVSSSFTGGGLRNPNMNTLKDGGVYQMTNMDVIKQEIANSVRIVNGKKVNNFWEFVLMTEVKTKDLAQFGPTHLSRTTREVSIEEVTDDEGNVTKEIVPGEMRTSTGTVVKHVLNNFSEQNAAMQYIFECAKHGYFIHCKVERVLTFRFGSTTETKEAPVYEFNWYKDGKIITDMDNCPPLTFEADAAGEA